MAFSFEVQFTRDSPLPSANDGPNIVVLHVDRRGQNTSQVQSELTLFLVIIK